MTKNNLPPNITPGMSLTMFKIRGMANAVRTFLMLKVKYRWVRSGGFARIPFSTRFFSPHRNVSLGDRVQFGRNCVVQCDIVFGNDILIAGNVSFVGRDDHIFDVAGKSIWDSPRGDRHMATNAHSWVMGLAIK